MNWRFLPVFLLVLAFTLRANPLPVPGARAGPLKRFFVDKESSPDGVSPSDGTLLLIYQELFQPSNFQRWRVPHWKTNHSTEADIDVGATLPPEVQCQDRIPGCGTLLQLCCSLKDVMKRSCGSSCGFCSSQVEVGNGSVTDPIPVPDPCPVKLDSETVPSNLGGAYQEPYGDVETYYELLWLSKFTGKKNNWN